MKFGMVILISQGKMLYFTRAKYSLGFELLEIVLCAVKHFKLVYANVYIF